MTQEASRYNNGSIQVLASGGREPYNYEIIGTTCGLSHRSLQAGPIFLNLPACTYTVLVIDVDGQFSSSIVTIGGNYIGPSASIAVDGCSFTVTSKTPIAL